MTDEEIKRIARVSGDLRHLYMNIVTRAQAIQKEAHGIGFSDVTYQESDRTERAAKHDLGLLGRSIAELETLTQVSVPDRTGE